MDRATENSIPVVQDVRTELALMRQSLDTVIDIHGKELVENKTTITSAHSKISVLELQSNTHEIKIAQLTEKSMSAFGKSAVIISTSVGALSLLWNVVRQT